MNYIDHKELWNAENLLNEYDVKQPKLLFFERFILSRAIERIGEKNIQKILCVGCGAGRDVGGVYAQVPNAQFYANDIAEQMLKRAEQNFKTWGIADRTKTVFSPAEELPFNAPMFDVITFLNNVITCILPHEKRKQMFERIYPTLKDNGVIVGVVHNRIGTPQKTLYFLQQRMFAFLQGREKGDRIAGRKDQPYMAHYFTRQELKRELDEAGFKNVEIYSLVQLSKILGRKYNRLKGFNNLVFIANK